MQEDGDYRESWQPQAMSEAALAGAREVSARITRALCGSGIFGAELFICGDEVIFSEVSPRPHDTGMVTMATQRLSEFALHARAILGLPIPTDADGIVPMIAPAPAPCCSPRRRGEAPQIDGLSDALATAPSVDVRLFGKPDSRPGRRMGVALATGDTADAARATARAAATQLRVAG